MANHNNELRVFISSTFRDLQEEREHLMKKIFPEIRSLCRQRGIRFTEVDLRWGLTDEDAILGQLIRTCLEEVDKCRPYFIGITGDRYGFIPSYLDIQKDPALLEGYPWIEDAAADQMSITEMEAHYGVLNPEYGEAVDGSRTRFYFRHHRQSLDDSGEDEERTRLVAYQERIGKSGQSIEQFRDPTSLGELIYDDLIRIIKTDFADARPPTPLEQERMRHQAFSLSRRRAYIANPVYLKKLNDHAASETPPLVVYAESGSGKSSLFAYWAEQYRRKNPEAHIVEHYVGIGATSTDHYAVIRHFCMEVKERFGRQEEIPSDPKELDLAFGQWLGYADHELGKSNQRMVVILDGLNQLQGTALGLKWIPDVISPRIRLILSSTVEGTLMELRKRGWSQLGMQALSEAERETIVVRYLAEYHKSLSVKQIRRIAGDYKCGHPLFLKTVLEELRLVGRHEELDQRISGYLESTGTEDLFQHVLERMEEDHGARAVRQVMVLLSGSRSGLDERELSEISGLARLKITTMVAGLDYHLVRKEGYLTYFHDYLRRAVEKRYLSDGEKQRQAHLDIAGYFEGLEVGQRTSRELLYQLHAAGAGWRLAGALSNIPLFLSVYQGETQNEVLGYWSELVGEHDVESAYGAGLSRWVVAEPEERSRAMGGVANLLGRLGCWEGALSLSRDRLAGAVERGDRSAEASSRRSLGWLLSLRGANSEAYAELSLAVDLYTELGNRLGVSNAIGNMGVVYSNRGEYERALESYEQSLIISQELGNRRGISNAIGNMGIVYAKRGEYERALESYEQKLIICQELGDRSSISNAIGNMGEVYYRRGDYERAIECYEQSLIISQELGDRRGISLAIGNMGEVYYIRGEYARALECYAKASEGHRAIGVRDGLTHWLAGKAGTLLRLSESAAGQMPAYIPEYLPGATADTWQAMCVASAREAAEECVAISDELSRQDTQFSGRVLLARIDAAEGHTNVAEEKLRTLLTEATGDDQHAELHYWLWKLLGKEEDRNQALDLYRVLFEKTPVHDYRMRIDEIQSSFPIPDRMNTPGAS